MNSKGRNFVKIIEEICLEEKISLESFSSGWVLKLCKDNINKYIFGYKFELNPSAVDAICCDKSAASDVMKSFNIPNIEHEFFVSPQNQKYVGESGTWGRLMELLNKNKKLVCKPNDGAGGNNVYLVCSQKDLELATYNIFKTAKAMAVSPYYEIENEYRTIVLNGDIKLIYSKKRPYVIGNGIDNFGKLLLLHSARYGGHDVDNRNINKEMLSKIIVRDENVYLYCKHNLGQGAKAEILYDEAIIDKVTSVVLKITGNMDVKFASIDIVETEDEYKVLEINSGVMMEHLSKQSNELYSVAKEIYREAILSMFNS